jgi:hypothetical protein
MKRLSFRSVMVFGAFGFVVTGTASAAAAAESKAKTMQPSDPTPAGGGANPTAEPEAAPEEVAAPAATVSLGESAGTRVSDTPNASAAEPVQHEKPRRWAGSQIFAASSMSTSTVFRGQQQYANPTVDAALYFTPRFAINDAFQLRGRLIFNYEFTNSDTTVTKNEPRFSDTALQLFYRKIPELPGGIKPAVSLNVSLPTSVESRARTMIASPGATVQFSKSFEHIPGDGELDLLASSSYAHPFYTHTTAGRRDGAPYAFHCVGGANCSDQLSGAFNPSNLITYSLIISATWGKWSPALFYNGVSQWVYKGSQNLEYAGRPVQAPDGFDPTHVRQTSYFSTWLDYQANSWLTAEVGYSLSRSALAEDGTRGNPFFDRYQDQRVYVGANFNIDSLMKKLEGGSSEGGIIRAQNRKPIGMF